MSTWLGPLLALSVGLAMDATAVAAARGLATRAHALRDGAALAIAFGLFQGAMPVLGSMLGSAFGAGFAAWDHWIAFVLLVLLGGKMLREAWTSDPESETIEPLRPRLLLTLSIATSIDALAAGLTLPAIGAPIAVAAAAIGVTTFVLSAIGFALGRQLGAMAGKRLDAFGGLVLIALGVKILAEHTGWL